MTDIGEGALAAVGGAKRDEPPPEKCDKNVPPAPQSVIGTCEYYKWRHQNFLERHVTCAHSPPDYYLNYGYKYCVRFSTKLYPKLTPVGQQWLNQARILLQVYMEQGLSENMAQDKSLELSNTRFRKFSFDTHPNAYWNAGFSSVPWVDRIKIATTPDFKEWLSKDTWSQFLDILGRMFSDTFSSDSSRGGGQFGGGGASGSW